jgi:Kef-type K+ transport system membrane component KefB
MTSSIASIAIVFLVAVIAPIAASLIGRVVKIPLVVFEIVLGIVVGPSVLGWVHPDDLLSAISNFGLVLLFFMAGNEINFQEIRGRPINRASLGWLISLVVGIVVGIALPGGTVGGIFIGIALTSTALGTIMPILRDAGELRTPLGKAVTAIGTAGEFGPLVAISLFLSGRRPSVAAVVLIAFVVVAGLAVLLAVRNPHRRMHELVTASLHTSGQFAVRLIILIVVALVCLSLVFKLDMLLGAFAAGILARALLRGASEPDTVTIERKLEALSFGLFVPVFFITTGVTFNLTALISDPRALILLPIFLVLLLLVRGIPGTLASPPGSTWRDRTSIALFAATGLPIIVAVTNIGLEEKAIQPGTAAALVGAGMLSVLLFPLLALIGRSAPADEESVPASERPPDFG